MRPCPWLLLVRLLRKTKNVIFYKSHESRLRLCLALCVQCVSEEIHFDCLWLVSVAHKDVIQTFTAQILNHRNQTLNAPIAVSCRCGRIDTKPFMYWSCAEFEELRGPEPPLRMLYSRTTNKEFPPSITDEYKIESHQDFLGNTEKQDSRRHW